MAKEESATVRAMRVGANALDTALEAEGVANALHVTVIVTVDDDGGTTISVGGNSTTALTTMILERGLDKMKTLS